MTPKDPAELEEAKEERRGKGRKRPEDLTRFRPLLFQGTVRVSARALRSLQVQGFMGLRAGRRCLPGTHGCNLLEGSASKGWRAYQQGPQNPKTQGERLRGGCARSLRASRGNVGRNREGWLKGTWWVSKIEDVMLDGAYEGLGW